MSFLAHGIIGLKLIGAAQAIYSSRQGDAQIETSIAKLEGLGKAFFASGCFFRVHNDGSMFTDDDALSSPELSVFVRLLSRHWVWRPRCH